MCSVAKPLDVRVGAANQVSKDGPRLHLELLSTHLDRAEAVGAGQEAHRVCGHLQLGRRAHKHGTGGVGASLPLELEHDHITLDRRKGC